MRTNYATNFDANARLAKKRSEKDGRLRFVIATASGYKILLKRLKFQDCWWTNGSDCGLWDAFAPRGRTQHEIAQEMSREMDSNCG